MRNSPLVMAISPKDLLDALNFRYATKAFDPSRKIPAETWQALEASLVLTPSSFGLQPWRFMVIDTMEIREKLKIASWGQAQITDSSHLVVFTARTDLSQLDIDAWVARVSEVQGKPIEVLTGLSKVISSFSKDMDVRGKHAWNSHQVYIALGQLMAAAALMGIDTCPLEGFSPAEYDEILGLEGSGYATKVCCALGYRLPDDRFSTAKKARFPHEQVIVHV